MFVACILSKNSHLSIAPLEQIVKQKIYSMFDFCQI